MPQPENNEIPLIWKCIVWPLQLLLHIVGGLRDFLIVTIPILGKVVQVFVRIISTILMFFMRILDSKDKIK